MGSKGRQGVLGVKAEVRGVQGVIGTSMGSQGVKGYVRGQGIGLCYQLGSTATIDGSSSLMICKALQMILRIQSDCGGTFR